MLKRRPVLTFYLVVFALTLVGTWLAFFVFHGSLWVEWFATFTPALAALVLTALLDGKTGVTELLARLFRWKIHWKWYLAVFALPLLFALVWVVLNTLVDGQEIAAGWSNLIRFSQAFLKAAPGLLAITLPMALMITGEEVGWRGFALERLLKTQSPVVASIIVGFFWGIWHLPSALDSASVLNKAPLPYSITLFTFGTIVFSFAYTWFWQNTRGSLIIVCLFHSFYDLLNYFTAAMFPSFYVRFWLYLMVMGIVLLPVWLLRRDKMKSIPLFSRADLLPKR